MKFIQSMMLMTCCALPFSSAHAALTLFNDDGNGGYEIDYGPGSGFFTTSALFSGPFGVLDPNNINSAIEALSLTQSSSGFGTGLVTIDFELTNTSDTTYSGLGFAFRVDPVGDGSFSATEQGTATFPSVSDAAEPDGWEIDEFFGNINQHFTLGDPLDNSDECGTGCDLVYAMNWMIDDLLPSETVVLSIGLSDDGQALSSRYLDAVSVDDPSTTLRFSGTVAPIPLPASLHLFLSAGVISFCLRKNTRKQKSI